MGSAVLIPEFMANELQGAGGHFYLTQRWTVQLEAKLLLKDGKISRMVLYH